MKICCRLEDLMKNILFIEKQTSFFKEPFQPRLLKAIVKTSRPQNDP